jgi:hypothetical protein
MTQGWYAAAVLASALLVAPLAPITDVGYSAALPAGVSDGFLSQGSGTDQGTGTGGTGTGTGTGTGGTNTGGGAPGAPAGASTGTTSGTSRTSGTASGPAGGGLGQRDQPGVPSTSAPVTSGGYPVPNASAPPPATPAPPAAPHTALTITIAHSTVPGHDGRFTLSCHPSGGTHPDPVNACAKLDQLAGSGGNPFAAVPLTTMCSQIFGGPATAQITGTWAGHPVSASFNRTNGCQTTRWNNLLPVLSPESAS